MQRLFGLVGTAASAALVVCTAANAAIMEVTINSEWGSTVDSNMTFEMPAVVSIDSITLEIAHQAIGDLENVTLSGPGNFFELLDENSTADGSFVSLGLAANDPSLSNVAPYVFRETGAQTFDLTEADLLGGYDGIRANDWSNLAGVAEAGTYFFAWRDGMPENGGAIGKLIVEYTEVPAPGVLAVLGIGGLVVRGRRRRG